MHKLEARLKQEFNKNITLQLNGTCIECTSHYKDRDGYTIVCDKTRKQHRLHRKVYELTRGPIPDGYLVRHLCHNPGCCNPAHLEIGTHQDNKDDTVRVSRHAIGERNRHAKLTQDQAIEIKYSDKPTKYFAEKYGVTYETVQQIRRGVQWKHI